LISEINWESSENMGSISFEIFPQFKTISLSGGERTKERKKKELLD